MAEFPNNDFRHDSIAEHMLRINMCVNGMANHPEVAFRGDLVARMTAHRDEFESLENQHAAEWGDEQAATAYTNLCEDALSAKLSSARYLINSMIEEEELVPVTANELRRDFGVEGSKPRDRDGMIAEGKKMVETNQRLVDDGSPYALPEDFFADLETKTHALGAAINAHALELNERLTVGEAKIAERDRGDRLLSNAFNWLVALYGEDANILLEFGMVPKSQIHTPGQPDPELPVFPNPPATFTLSLRADGTIEVVWTGVTGATHMLLEKRKQGEVDWSLVMNGLPADPAEILPYIDPYISPGIWEYRMIPMNGDEHGMEIVAVIVVPEG